MTVQLKKLAEVAFINPRRPQIERGDNESTSFVPMENVDDVLGAIVNLNSVPFSKAKKGYTYFENDDVIFAKITPCMQNGKHAVLSGLIDGIGFGSTEFHVIRAGNDLIPEWIHYYLRRQETLNAAIKTFTGAVGQQRVPADFLENLELPIPTKDKQRKITTRLKAQLAEVEKARQAVQEQLRDAAVLKSKALITVFGNVSAHARIGSVAKLQSGYAFKSDTFTTSGVHLLRNANILPGKVYWDVPCS